MNVIFECCFGSVLYGTNHANSDTDIKGIYIPSKNEMLTKTDKPFVIENTKDGNSEKNLKDDIDKTYYSLQYYLKLLAEGNTEAMDMLHCNKKNTLITSPVWEYIQSRRTEFYSKNMSCFISYVKTQAAKYGIKGTRLNSIKAVMDILQQNKNTKLKDIFIQGKFDELINNDEFINIKPVIEEDKIIYSKTMLEVCSKEMNLTANSDYLYASLDKYYKTYGVRAEQARRNEGIDFKAVSHAIRACFQILEIFETGNLVFPLKEAEFIKDVKLGKYHYLNDGIDKKIEQLYEEVMKKVESCSFPDKIDSNLVNEIILKSYEV